MKRFNPNKLYKNPKAGKVAGVCAGIADYFDINVCAIRWIWALGTLFSGIWPGVIVYIILAIVLDGKPREIIDDPEEDAFWREARTKPDYMAVNLKERFRDMERRTRSLEAYITSKQFRLNRQLRELED